jgi:hypothetical protein
MQERIDTTALPPLSLPKYEDLPDIDLYMDQVISLMEKYLGPGPTPESRLLTPAMVNNYVKMKAMPPPVKKRYTRSHLVYLLVICSLKQVVPIASIRDIIVSEIRRLGESDFYRQFSARYAGACAEVRAEYAETMRNNPTASLANYADLILRSAIAARAEQSFGEGLLAQVQAAREQAAQERAAAERQEKAAKAEKAAAKNVRQEK